ncbi:MAG TPA: metallophosphoesterase [Treponema sp.]|nr:MAG: hypothetical protein A2001_15230 [Treponema sp. GWC1_61_84]OHE72292.1 MAG: hypothetical protein A2413_14905 [Treponema sp. RIFOXYC1_FULL_61_9]HCM28282.1 metallophosphoesterase [Treponema sp.]
MRALIVSDIHANLAALEAVLRDSAGKWDIMACLGDIVGYGPDPNEAVARVMETADIVLLGNHDLAACGRIDIAWFSVRARIAMEWTMKRISADSLGAFAGLRPIEERYGILFSHGNPADPVWGYVLDSADAAEAFRARNFRLCLLGHSHTSAAFSAAEGGPRTDGLSLPALFAPKDLPFAKAGADLPVGNRRWILNPGSVGFPRTAEEAPSRGGTARAIARYALLDLDSMRWSFMKAVYDMRPTAARMRDEGLW